MTHDKPQVRRRPITILLAAVCLLVCAAAGAIFGVLILGQVNAFTTRAASVDPTGPDTGEYIQQAHTGLRLIGIVGFIAALVFLALVIALIRPVRGDIGANPRRITLIVICALAAIYPVYGAISGGVGYHLVAIPPEYNGDNAVNVTLPHSFQSTAVTLDIVAIILLLLVIVLLSVPITARYFRQRIDEHRDDDYVSYLHRQAGG